MSKIKVLTVVGTRPEIIKLSEVIKVLDKNVDHFLAHTGQNYDFELNEVFFKEMDIRKPDNFFEITNNNYASAIGEIISKTDQLIDKIKPDAFLIYGDTNSCLSAIAAKRNHVPIFHMEAGNRCFDERVPEETNRKIVDHISDINLTISDHAKSYLMQEGISPNKIIKVGSCMKEILDKYKENIDNSCILEKLNLSQHKYFLASIHREETVDNDLNIRKIFEALNETAEKFGFPILVSTHPRTQKSLDMLSNFKFHDLINFSKPFGFFDYIRLQKDSLCVLSDSGTISEESSILNFNAITIRQSHERPEGMDEGTLIMTGLEAKDILGGINSVIKNPNKEIVNDYNVPNVSSKVLKIILSYYHYIDREVWKKGV